MRSLDELKAAAGAEIDREDESLRELSRRIHSAPELNFEEVQAHAWLTGYLEERGFDVERGAYGLPTAFRAVAGSGSPAIAVLCEYDALPEIGHACGHNLIAAAGVAAGLGLKEALAPGEGTVIILGSPAEEGGGGKVFMVEAGAFDGVVAAMMVHPAPSDSVWPNVVAIQSIDVEYHGRNAHAAAFPWDGLNALDALVLAYNGISMLRQHLRNNARIHGVIRSGGAKPNIIPDFTSAEFYIRARNDAELEELKAKVLACFEGAATATGCRLEYRWTGKPYSNLTTIPAMAEAYRRNAAALGVTIPDRDDDPMAASPGSTDMGNVSHVAPTIHPYFAIPTEGSNHTPAFTTAAGSDEAHRAMLRAGKAMAMTAIDLYRDPGLLERVRTEFTALHRE